MMYYIYEVADMGRRKEKPEIEDNNRKIELNDPSILEHIAFYTPEEIEFIRKRNEKILKRLGRI
jgi:hypothetical protein